MERLSHSRQYCMSRITFFSWKLLQHKHRDVLISGCETKVVLCWVFLQMNSVKKGTVNYFRHQHRGNAFPCKHCTSLCTLYKTWCKWSGAPNNCFLINTLKTLFRLSRWNLTFCKSENFSNSSLHRFSESENCTFPFYHEK